jgi:AraC-like DNA-binding protein
MKKTAQPVPHYAEFLPALALRGEVLCLWEQKTSGDSQTHPHRVLPDGCIDIVLIDGELPAVVGPWTEAFIANFSPGTQIVGARFHPGRAARLLGIAASELLNQNVPLRDMWRKARSERFLRIAETKELAARRRELEAALSVELAMGVDADREVGVAMEWLARTPGIRLEPVSRRLGMSSRQLQRRFRAAVGYGPKLFQAVLRFQRLLHLSQRRGGGASLAELSLDAGYADQAHMTREVRRFSGIAPAALLTRTASALQMSELVGTPWRDRDGAVTKIGAHKGAG